MGRKSSISRLPPGMRADVNRMLADGSMTLDEIICALHEDYGNIADLPSRSALGRYGQDLTRRLAAIKASTEAAKVIAAAAPDSADARSEALTAMIQAELFESIMALQEAKDEEMEPGERVDLLAKAAKNIATLTRSSVTLKRYQAEAEERIKAKAMEAVEKALGDDMPDRDAALRRVREEVYGIVAG